MIHEIVNIGICIPKASGKRCSGESPEELMDVGFIAQVPPAPEPLPDDEGVINLLVIREKFMKLTCKGRRIDTTAVNA